MTYEERQTETYQLVFLGIWISITGNTLLAYALYNTWFVTHVGSWLDILFKGV